ncbi:unnamed protein product [Rotaria sordida]|uniref:Uncharacterized protein n=1 Tax=Rotaria sordida TaxID=392033 RepID=A0A819PNX1_9BILA|nr:unnamed protein product [Rotaria sordida]CAF1360093.1 unnamed protein product [Rotaria sordida]CAF1388253.1 unnamed protein product [Rotaria sordida]CAF3818542.1 unnamed protein product [Rotaria sordida]CAF4016257.1 unnamed protein product [Rotaria sordida]
MKNVREQLLHRSLDNHVLALRHNRQEDEMLKEKFSIYQRNVRRIDYKLYVAERRCQQHAKNDLGLVVSYKYKPIEETSNHQFYYTLEKRFWTIKEYSVEPLYSVLQHKSSYEFVFERHAQKYIEELKQRKRLENLRKEHFMNTTESFTRDDYEKSNDWPRTENARLKLPLIHHSKLNHSPKIRFPIEM